jgi:hypothetical protein
MRPRFGRIEEGERYRVLGANSGSRRPHHTPISHGSFSPLFRALSPNTVYLNSSLTMCVFQSPFTMLSLETLLPRRMK